MNLKAVVLTTVLVQCKNFIMNLNHLLTNFVFVIFTTWTKIRSKSTIAEQLDEHPDSPPCCLA